MNDKTEMGRLTVLNINLTIITCVIYILAFKYSILINPSECIPGQVVLLQEETQFCI